jgi:hypothetical protein
MCFAQFIKTGRASPAPAARRGGTRSIATRGSNYESLRDPSCYSAGALDYILSGENIFPVLRECPVLSVFIHIILVTLVTFCTSVRSFLYSERVSIYVTINERLVQSEFI